MASGITVDDDCKSVYEDLKMHKKHPYVIYRISEDLKNVKVDYVAAKGEEYSTFVEKMQAAAENQQGRYAVVDVEYDVPGKSTQKKCVFIMWNCENIPIKQKMVYTSTKKSLMDKLTGIHKEYQCTDIEDLKWSEIVAGLQKK